MIPEEDEVLPSTREELLKLAATRASGNPVTLSIRRLLDYWGAKRRGYWITDEITRDLTAARLATRPPFTEGWIDSLISLIPIASEMAQPDGSALPSIEAAATAGVQVSLRVNSLASANAGVESVRLDDPP